VILNVVLIFESSRHHWQSHVVFVDDAGDMIGETDVIIENNIIENSGDDDGAGIEVTGETKDIRLVGKTITETRAPGRCVLKLQSLTPRVINWSKRAITIITGSVSEGFAGTPPKRHKPIPHSRFGL